ncbi:hypothetical protein BX070DRAFT_226005 [Coemansia spiralis]|nr:hypothetical protein BX070DRAFT_226005 [Coemansia spiralis]
MQSILKLGIPKSSVLLRSVTQQLYVTRAAGHIGLAARREARELCTSKVCKFNDKAGAISAAQMRRVQKEATAATKKGLDATTAAAEKALSQQPSFSPTIQRAEGARGIYFITTVTSLLSSRLSLLPFGKQRISSFYSFYSYYKLSTTPAFIRTLSIVASARNSIVAGNPIMSQHYSIIVPGGSPSRPTTPLSATSSVSSVGSTVGMRGVSNNNTGNERTGSEEDLEKSIESSEQGGTGGKKEPEKKPGRFRVLMQQYGRIAVLMYLLVSAVDLSLCVWGVWLGGDGLVYTINSYLGQYIPRLQKAAQKMEEGQSGGADKWATILIVGYAVHKCLTPLRLAVTAALLPWSARTAQSWGLTWLIPKSAPKVGHHKPIAKAAEAIRRKLK